MAKRGAARELLSWLYYAPEYAADAGYAELDELERKAAAWDRLKERVTKGDDVPFPQTIARLMCEAAGYTTEEEAR